MGAGHFPQVSLSLHDWCETFWFLFWGNPLGALGWFYCRNLSDLIALPGWWVAGCFSLVSSLPSHVPLPEWGLWGQILLHRRMQLGFYSLMSVSQRVTQDVLKGDRTGCIAPLFSVHKLHWFFSNTIMPLNSESKASGYYKPSMETNAQIFGCPPDTFLC